MPHPTRFALLHIGDELLSGLTENRLTAPLAAAIRTHGASVAKAVVLPDDRPRVVAEIRSALAEGLAIVSTGGLGATEDDITRDAFAEALGTVTVELPDAAERLTAQRAARGQATRPADLRQARILAGGVPLANPAGDALGIACVTGRHGAHHDIFLLPGPPREVLPMWRESVAPLLTPSREDLRPAIILRSIGWRTAAEIDALLRPLRPEGLALSFGTDSGILDIRMVDTGAGPAVLEAFATRVRGLAGDHVFGVAGDSLLEAALEACRAAGIPFRCDLDIPANTDCAPRELHFALDAIRRRALVAARP